MTREAEEPYRCECDTAFLLKYLDNFDFTNFSGVKSILHNVPGYHCTKCRRETIDGEVINDCLKGLAGAIIVKVSEPWPDSYGAFLRKRLHIAKAPKGPSPWVLDSDTWHFYANVEP